MSFKTFRTQFQTNFERIEKPMICSKTILVAKVYLDQFVLSVIYPVFFMVTTTMLLELTEPETVFFYRTEEGGKVEFNS